MSKIKLTIKLGALLAALCFHLNAFAVINPMNLLRGDYLYHDDEIRAVLQARLDASTTHVAPAVPFENHELSREIGIASAKEVVLNGKSAALIPINFGNSHWAALALKRNSDGTLHAIYGDPLGTPLTNHGNNAADFISILQHFGIQFTDLQIRQQSDGSSCGAFTAENLAKIAETDLSGLSDDEIRNLFSSINNATEIRRSHFSLLYTGDKIIDVEALKPKSETTANKLASQNKTLINGMNNIHKLIDTRITGIGNTTAVAAGEENSKHGAWVKAFMGSGSDKNSSIDAKSENALDSKSSLRGFILGADTEISEGLTIGIAFSRIESKSKYTSQGTTINTDNITNNVYSFYGSDELSDNFWLNGNISTGNIVINAKDQTPGGNSIKQKGNLLSGALSANYKLYSDNRVTITPRVGTVFNSLTLNGYEDSSIKIEKTKQRNAELSAGSELAYLHDATHFRIIPKLNVDYSRMVWNKGNKITINNLIDQNIIDQKISSKKGTAKVGVGFVVETDNIEISNGYEYSAQGKSKNHMGYAKLRVNF